MAAEAAAGTRGRPGGPTRGAAPEENVLRPIVIGRDTNMSDYLILVSTLGGIMVFDLAGFVAGPVIAALFLVLWDLFAEEYVRSEPDAPPGPAPARPAARAADPVAPALRTVEVAGACHRFGGATRDSGGRVRALPRNHRRLKRPVPSGIW